MSRSWDEEHSSTRSDLVKELQGKLEEYDGLVLREHQLLKIKAPSKKNHRQYFRYMWNTKPLCEEETRFICQEDDMLYLSTDAEAAWMESAFDFIIAILPAKVMKVSQSFGISQSCHELIIVYSVTFRDNAGSRKSRRRELEYIFNQASDLCDQIADLTDVSDSSHPSRHPVIRCEYSSRAKDWNYYSIHGSLRGVHAVCDKSATARGIRVRSYVRRLNRHLVELT